MGRQGKSAARLRTIVANDETGEVGEAAILAHTARCPGNFADRVKGWMTAIP